MTIGAAIDNASETSGDLNKEAWDKYNALRTALLVYHNTDGSHLSTGDVVLKALFDANTILAASTDDTPAALSVAASRIIGRASTGGIAALTASQVNNILGTATKALDNLASVAINVSLISDTDNTDDLGSATYEWKDLYIDGTANIDSLVADTADINGGTVDGITSLTAAGNLDIGAYNFRAASLTADGLTATRVVFAGANGLLSDDSDFTFVTDTLTVTKLGAFEATGAINFGSQAMTSVDINSGTVSGITFDGALTMSLGSDVDGDIYYRSSNVLTRLAKGTQTHVLTMGASIPEWAAAAGGVDTSGTPVDNDFAKFTDADTIEGRSYSETVSDLSVDTRRLENLCRNAAFASRSGGTSAIPDEWTLEGTPTVAYDTVDTTYGDYAVKLTASGAGDEGINQTLTHLKISTKYQVFARVKVDAGDTASIITTGATTNIDTDSTSATWETKTGEFTTDASGTDVVLKLVASADTDVAYFCGITCVEGDIPPGNFVRRGNEVIYLAVPLIDASWDGDGKSDGDSGIIDLSAFGNGCPPKIKAVLVSICYRDADSANTDTYLGLCSAAQGSVLEMSIAVFVFTVTNDTLKNGGSWSPCDSNGDIYVRIEASGAGTGDVWIFVHGYILGE